MHVAMLIGALTKGGAERVLVNLADDLIQKGHQVTMVTQYLRENEYPLNPKVKRVISDITEEETGKSRVLNFCRRFLKLRGIWKTEKPDVILSFIGKNNIMTILTSRLLAIPVAVSVRAEPSEEYYNTLLAICAKVLFQKADCVILQTRQAAEYFPKRLEKKICYLKNPINESFFRDPYVGERKRKLVAVGRVDENKNHKLLIDAFASIAKDYAEEQLIIYGEGELRQSLQDYVKDLGLEDQIKLPGSVDQVAEQIEGADGFVLCSNTEGSPNTLIEAMVLGLPVISTDCPCGGPADLIIDGVNGLLVPVGNVQAMADALRKLLSDSTKAKQMGEEARKLNVRYEKKQVCKEWEDTLQSLIAE